MWLGQGIVDGATTNPSIMFKDGVADIEAGALRICKLLGDRPLSVEVTSNHHETMMEQGRLFATWGRNIVIKIPIVTEFGASCLAGFRWKASARSGTSRARHPPAPTSSPSRRNFYPRWSTTNTRAKRYGSSTKMRQRLRSKSHELRQLQRIN